MSSNKLYLNLIFLVDLIFFLAFLFAWTGFFYPFLILTLALIIILILVKKKIPTKPKAVANLANIKTKKEITRWKFTALITIALICLFIFIGFSPSYLGGRDPGAMVEAAVMLTKEHRLEFTPRTLSIFDNQGADSLALNYPGFIITENHTLKTQFNIGYVSYLAFWYSLLGETGLKIANLFGIILGFWAVFLIIKKISKNAVLGLSALPLLFLSFPFFWYSRQNLAESMAFGFLFAAIYCLINFYQNPKTQKASGLLALFSLFCFTLIRIEGILIFLIALFVLYKISKQKKVIFFNRQTILLLLFGTIIFLSYSFTIVPFYKKMFKDIIGYNAEQETFSLQISSLQESFLRIRYIFAVLFKYGLALIVTLGLVKIMILLGKLIFKKTHLISKTAIPLIIGGPFLIYFIKPTISLDHPWMLRRFMFAVIPLLIIYAVLFIYEKIKNKRLAFTILALMTALQVLIFLNYGFIKENPQSINNVQILAKQFNENDLILVDKSSSPNDWSLLSEPLRYLFDKNAVYIYNPQDINKIPKQDFNKTYLLTSKEKLGYYQNFINSNGDHQDIAFNFKQLETAPFDKKTDYAKPITLPRYQEQEKIFYLYELEL